MWKYGGEGSCSESVMTAAARMALTFLWHDCHGGVSRLGPRRRVLSDTVLEQHPVIFSALALQSLPFGDVDVPKHHHVSITLSSNGPTLCSLSASIPGPQLEPFCSIFSPVNDRVVLTLDCFGPASIVGRQLLPLAVHARAYHRRHLSLS